VREYVDLPSQLGVELTAWVVSDAGKVDDGVGGRQPYEVSDVAEDDL
jgi:hypothetical protein